MTSIPHFDNLMASMDLYRLRSLMVLAEQRHFGRAARVLGMTQPALSKQVAQVEDELGAALFSRGRGGVDLTAVGRSVVGRAGPMLAGMDELVREARRTARGETGLLRLGFGVTTAGLVARLVVELRRKMEGIAIEMQDMSTPEQVAGLDAGTLDLGFVRLPAPARFQVLPVLEDDLVALAPRGTKAGSWRRADFVLLARDASPTFHAHVLRVCGELGFRPRVVLEARDYLTVLALVESGLGITILPESATRRMRAGVRRIRLHTPAARWQIGAVWRRDAQNAALESFRVLLTAACDPRRASRGRWASQQ
jgi:DNA-binding transcriptional LysR family regulator